MITKQIKNTGAAGGHGMATINTVEEIQKEEARLVKEHKGHTVGCRVSCGETFCLDIGRYTSDEALALAAHMEQHGCPYCTGQRENYAKDSVEFEALSLGDKVFECIRKPDGWRPPRKAKTMEQIMKSHARAMKNYVR